MITHCTSPTFSHCMSPTFCHSTSHSSLHYMSHAFTHSTVPIFSHCISAMMSHQISSDTTNVHSLNISSIHSTHMGSEWVLVMCNEWISLICSDWMLVMCRSRLCGFLNLFPREPSWLLQAITWFKIHLSLLNHPIITLISIISIHPIIHTPTCVANAGCDHVKIRKVSQIHAQLQTFTVTCIWWKHWLRRLRWW